MELTSEQLWRLHRSGGGQMTWREVGQHAGISWQSARSKVRWWLKKHPDHREHRLLQLYIDHSNRSLLEHPVRTPPGLPETAVELESRVRHIEDMLEKLVGKRNAEEDAESDDIPF